MALKDNLAYFARKAGEKAGAAIEIGKLTAKIHKEKSNIDRYKLQIGELIFQAFEDGESFSADINNLCADIKDSKVDIELLRSAVDAVKHPEECMCYGQCDDDEDCQNCCPSCGDERPEGSDFCPNCGSKESDDE